MLTLQLSGCQNREKLLNQSVLTFDLFSDYCYSSLSTTVGIQGVLRVKHLEDGTAPAHPKNYLFPKSVQRYYKKRRCLFLSCLNIFHSRWHILESCRFACKAMGITVNLFWFKFLLFTSHESFNFLICKNRNNAAIFYGNPEILMRQCS